MLCSIYSWVSVNITSTRKVDTFPSVFRELLHFGEAAYSPYIVLPFFLHTFLQPIPKKYSRK